MRKIVRRLFPIVLLVAFVGLIAFGQYFMQEQRTLIPLFLYH